MSPEAAKLSLKLAKNARHANIPGDVGAVIGNEQHAFWAHLIERMDDAFAGEAQICGWVLRLGSNWDNNLYGIRIADCFGERSSILQITRHHLASHLTQ